MKQGDTRSNPTKLLDSWIYEVKDVEITKQEYDRETDENKTVKHRIVNKKVTVEIRLEKQTTISAAPPHPLEKVSIYAVCPELGIRIDGSDFIALKDAMWAKLDKKFAITWERYFLVKIEKERLWGGGTGSGFTMSWDDVYKGTTHNGQVLMRRWHGSREAVEPWPGAFTDEKGKVLACIKATEGNREGLEEFRKRIDILRDKLSQFLRPEHIEITLSQLGSFNLLPPVNPPPKDSHAEKPATEEDQSEAAVGE